MITKYQANAGYRPEITKVECERETASAVFLVIKSRGVIAPPIIRRRAKESTYEAYFDTWLEAQQWLLKRYNNEVAQARATLQRAHGRLGNVKGMKSPDCQTTREDGIREQGRK